MAKGSSWHKYIVANQHFPELLMIGMLGEKKKIVLSEKVSLHVAWYENSIKLLVLLTSSYIKFMSLIHLFIRLVYFP